MASLANLFRPSTFGSAIGEAARLNGAIIRNQVRTGKISHTYLMTGLKGSGKTTTARTLARALNCLDLKEGEPCGCCKNCLAIQAGESMDVKEIDAARNNGVDFAKSIEEDASYQPLEMKRKVYILDECHCLTNDAFSSLLKLIEEPPEWAVFIFCTTDPQKMPATIRSRCQEYRFKAVSLKEMSAHLIKTAAEYGARLDEGGADVIARHSGGSVRDALMNLEICLGEEADVTAERVNDILGIDSWQQIFMMLNAIINNDKAFIIKSVERYYSDGRRVTDVISDCLQAVTDKLRHLAGASVEGNDEYIKLVSSLNLDEALAYELADALREVFEKIRYSSDKGMLTVALLKAASVRNSSIIVRLEAAEKKIAVLERIVSGNDGNFIVSQETVVAVPDKSVERTEPETEKPKEEPKVKPVELPDIFSFENFFMDDFSVKSPAVGETVKPSQEPQEKSSRNEFDILLEENFTQQATVETAADDKSETMMGEKPVPDESFGFEEPSFDPKDFEGFEPYTGDIPFEDTSVSAPESIPEPESVIPNEAEEPVGGKDAWANGLSLDELFDAVNNGASPQMKLDWECNTNSFLKGLIELCEVEANDKQVVITAPNADVKEGIICCLEVAEGLDCVVVR